jgi:hypothetical protein
MLARFAFSIVTVCSLVLVPGCVTRGSGQVAEETRTIEAFDALEASGSIDVFVRAGDAPSARVIGDDNLLPMIETRNVGETMRVRTTGSYMTTNGPEVHLTTTALKRIGISGSGKVDARDIASESLDLELSGSGELTIEGHASKVTIAMSGSGHLDATALQAEDVTITVSGSGSAKLTATTTLQASVSGSGTVRYRGNPNVEESVSGSGSVRPL